jgi:mannosylglycerate hydrolase
MSLSLKQRAEEILRENDRGRYTIPSSRLYPHQWAWDSGFAAIGWGHIDLERACQEVESILEGQWEDGRIPHIQFHNPDPDYFPGPESWGREKSSTISNPPVWTMAAERLLQIGADETRVRRWLPALEASHRFLVQHRDPLDWDCIATCHPWENGQDNSPAWDGPMESIDPEEAPAFQRVDTAKVEDASQRPTEIQYKRYMALVHRFTKNGFKIANFAVYDPFFTTLVILAEEALQRIADQLGEPSQAGSRAVKLRAGLTLRLWSPDSGRYRYYDAHNNVYHDTYTSGSLAPVLLGTEIVGYDQMLAALRKDFSSVFGIPTVAPRTHDFDPVCYWRGPTWINMNWLFTRALGEPLLDSTLALVEKSGFWEYFHPDTGKGLGTDRFTWTAALILDLIAQRESAS